MQFALHLLPASSFPFRLELLHYQTRKLLWSCTVSRPDSGTLQDLHIPAQQQLGAPVIVRAVWPDGKAEETPPAPEHIQRFHGKQTVQ